MSPKRKRFLILGMHRNLFRASHEAHNIAAIDELSRFILTGTYIWDCVELLGLVVDLKARLVPSRSCYASFHCLVITTIRTHTIQSIRFQIVLCLVLAFIFIIKLVNVCLLTILLRVVIEGEWALFRVFEQAALVSLELSVVHSFAADWTAHRFGSRLRLALGVHARVQIPCVDRFFTILLMRGPVE